MNRDPSGKPVDALMRKNHPDTFDCPMDSRDEQRLNTRHEFLTSNSLPERCPNCHYAIKVDHDVCPECEFIYKKFLSDLARQGSAEPLSIVSARLVVRFFIVVDTMFFGYSVFLIWTWGVASVSQKIGLVSAFLICNMLALVLAWRESRRLFSGIKGIRIFYGLVQLFRETRRIPRVRTTLDNLISTVAGLLFTGGCCLAVESYWLMRNPFLNMVSLLLVSMALQIVVAQFVAAHRHITRRTTPRLGR